MDHEIIGRLFLFRDLLVCLLPGPSPDVNNYPSKNTHIKNDNKKNFIKCFFLLFFFLGENTYPPYKYVTVIIGIYCILFFNLFYYFPYSK